MLPLSRDIGIGGFGHALFISPTARSFARPSVTLLGRFSAATFADLSAISYVTGSLSPLTPLTRSAVVWGSY